MKTDDVLDWSTQRLCCSSRDATPPHIHEGPHIDGAASTRPFSSYLSVYTTQYSGFHHSLSHLYSSRDFQLHVIRSSGWE
jgi:hypothetical protein